MKKTAALPFPQSKNGHFFDELGDFIGDVFYEILPDLGFELRDEQIFMAFQLEQAYKNKSVIFAEAGVGTGKTLVYLVYAICYARYMRKPAIISCADETLIEQLVKPGGDIEKLSNALNMEIDVRLAKAREQYVCVKKLNNIIDQTDSEEIEKVYDDIPSFVNQQGASMTSFKPYGDRKEYPWISDREWKKIAWDPLQQCSTCEYFHRCGQTLNRNHYRSAGDLVICSHDFYMEHVWTKESRTREGQLPLLPEASCVVFDEGHLLEFAAQKGLTYRFNAETLTTVLTGYLNQDVREESLVLIEDILAGHDEWFDILKESAKMQEESNRKEVPRTPEMLAVAEKLKKNAASLLDQLVFDSELYVLEEYHLKMIEEYLEFYAYGLDILLKDNEGIYWVEESKDTFSLVIMPRLVEEVLKKEVFSQKIPYVFSSATLSREGDFTFFSQSLGIDKSIGFTVDSPFDYNEKMAAYAFVTDEEEQKWQHIADKSFKNEGGSLVLFSSPDEMNRFRDWLFVKKPEVSCLFEGDQEISELVKKFQNNENQVLCAYHLWEGLDIPGSALNQVIIASLPFPPVDPVFKAKRQESNHPLEEVDIPYMLLRLRQGVGRLIRTATDEGVIHLIVSSRENEAYCENISSALPVKINY
ncbi:ATP-dependent DNA helicase [Alteribacter keqinensis]|uniref:ATP-dependent DNA helicase n=1 Tax=Alteribacter keqinensis TaxID=2483800 RepID=A0A3M7TYR3_9BACI|nr:ATP-dependent DNA helicase [Alteribacter keqinensis]RNA70603.1 ATP-dependent DNA helicase [Alteribacter keqinensis]